jgi:hypothetical protein
MGPRIVAASGRTRKPPANTAKVASMAVDGSTAGKNWAAIELAKKP